MFEEISELLVSHGSVDGGPHFTMYYGWTMYGELQACVGAAGTDPGGEGESDQGPATLEAQGEGGHCRRVIREQAQGLEHLL